MLFQFFCMFVFHFCIMDWQCLLFRLSQMHVQLENFFLKNIYIFRNLAKSLWLSVGSTDTALEEVLERGKEGRKKEGERKKERNRGREEGRKKEREKKHYKILYFPVQILLILLELLSPLLLICVRSDSGKTHRTAAIPYFEMSIKRNLDIIYRRDGRQSLFFFIPLNADFFE